MDYTYDREDRLVEGQAYQTNHQGHRVDREVTRLFYDGLGRRLAKEYDPKDGGGGVKRTEYTFDGLDPVVEYGLWNGQRDEFYRGEAGGLLTMRHFPDGTEGQSYWYHHDGRGSVAGVTKHEGQSTHNYRYDAYGQVLPALGNFTDPHNHYTFGGKEWDEHLNTYEFGFRLYDPWAGLWLTQDPLRGEPRRPHTLHRYAYAFASPISYRDPYGLAATPSDGGGGPQPPTPEPSEPTPTPGDPTPTPGGAQCTPTVPLERPSCPGAVAAGVVAAIPTIGWNIVIGYVAVQVALLPPPASVVGELILLPIEAVTFELDMLIGQLIAQGAQRECSDIQLQFWPPYDFGPARDDHP